MVLRRCTIIRGRYLFYFAAPPQSVLLGQHTAV